MKRRFGTKQVRVLVLVAGLMDTLTGAGLVVAPSHVATLMRVPPISPEAEPFLRWVGVFVAGVGVSYLVALGSGGAERLRHVLEFTTVIRAAVGLYTTVAIACGTLAPAWSTVPVTDLGLAAVQMWILAKGGWRDD